MSETVTVPVELRAYTGDIVAALFIQHHFDTHGSWPSAGTVDEFLQNADFTAFTPEYGGGEAETLAIFDDAARASHYEELWQRGEAELASLRSRIAELEARHGRGE